MVNVCVRQHHGINAAGIERKVAVNLERLASAALIHSTIQQDTATVRGGQQVHGPGDGFGCAKKC